MHHQGMHRQAGDRVEHAGRCNARTRAADLPRRPGGAVVGRIVTCPAAGGPGVSGTGAVRSRGLRLATTTTCRLAHVIADQVDGLTTSRFAAADLRVETKPDLTPVTDADRAAEELVRSQLQRTRPRDAVIGEEFDPTGHGARQWVDRPDRRHQELRPRRARSGPRLIALVDGGEPVLGVVSRPGAEPALVGRHRHRRLDRPQPVLGPADPGLRCGRPRPTPRCPTPRWTAGSSAAAAQPFLDLTREVWRSRAYGDFWSYMLLAEGARRHRLRAGAGVHDMAALVPVVVEAGGRFTSLAGVDGPFGGDALATNGRAARRGARGLLDGARTSPARRGHRQRSHWRSRAGPASTAYRSNQP